MDDNNCEAIRGLLANHAKLPLDAHALEADSDLFQAGLTSLTTVHLMLAIEDHFDVEFEDEMMQRNAFRTINAINQIVSRLQQQ